jgi:hypothetical protein
LEGSSSSLIEALHQNLPGVPEEDHKKSQPEMLMSKLRFKFNTSQIELKSAAPTDSVTNNPDGNNMTIIYGLYFTSVSHWTVEKK